MPRSLRCDAADDASGVAGDQAVRWEGAFDHRRRSDHAVVTEDRAAEKAAVLVPLLTQPGRVFDVTSPDLPTIRR